MSLGGQLTLWERIQFVSLLPALVFRIVTALIIKPNKGNLHWKQLIALRFLQCQRATFPPNILLWYIRRTSTGEAIQGYCASNSIPHKAITLDSAALDNKSTDITTPPGILHLLTPSPTSSSTTTTTTTTKTLLYLHGGGFVNPLRPAAHMPLILKLASASRTPRIAILEYSLAPEHPYPAQLIQSISALHYLLTDLSIPPGNLILAGDSAGGQMVGALLAHIVRPCPYAEAIPRSVFDAGGQIGAAVLISPFTVLEMGEASYERSEGLDYLDRRQMKGFEGAWAPRAGEVWSDLCEGEGAGEVWGEVFRGETGVNGYGKGIVRKTMIAVGTGEVFLDCCRLFAGEAFAGAETVIVERGTTVEEMGWEGRRDFVYAECEGEAHVQVALDCAVRYEAGRMMRAILSWLESL